MSKRYIKGHLVKVAPRTHLILDVKCCYSQSELDSRKQTLNTHRMLMSHVLMYL